MNGREEKTITAREMANKRWAKVGKAERRAYALKMVAARRAKRKKK